MKRKLAFMASLGYARMKPEEVCRSLSRLGYDGVEWTMNHFNPRKHSERQLRSLIKTTAESGLETSEVVVQQDLVVPDDKVRRDRTALVMECIQASAKAGVSILNVFTGPAPWNDAPVRIGRDISEGDAWEMVLESYELFVKEAEKNKINLAVEGVWGMLCRDYYTTRPLIDKFDSDYLGINFDPSHDVLAGNLDIGWIIKQWGKKIKHVHIKDATGIQELGKCAFPLPGEGSVDWKAFFEALDKIAYTGYMSVEFESFAYYKNVLNSDIEQAARISLNSIRQLVKQQAV